MSVLCMLTSSCKKEKKEISGCTDSNATNYNANATVNDGTCTYLPFQGPVNPGFEEVDLGWMQSSGNGYAGNGTAIRTTGTAFMPTKGSWYMSMNTFPSNNWYSGTCGMYQENIDFSQSDSLIFDYSVSGGNVVSASVEFLFTVNGTINLWSKSFTGAIPSTEKLNERVALPSLPDKGKFTINLASSGGAGTDIYFQIDNIRVK